MKKTHAKMTGLLVSIVSVNLILAGLYLPENSAPFFASTVYLAAGIVLLIAGIVLLRIVGSDDA